MSTPGLSPALAALNRIAIIGTGLIGASVAAALKSRGFTGKIVGCARSQQTLDKAIELGLADEVQRDVKDAVNGADLVLLAVPMMAGRDLLQKTASSRVTVLPRSKTLKFSNRKALSPVTSSLALTTLN